MSGPRTWGGLARKGSWRLEDGTPPGDWTVRGSRNAEDEADRWERVDDAGPERRSEKQAPRRPRVLPPVVQDELKEAGGTAAAPRLAERLAEASRAFERDRFTDARAVLVPLAQRVPTAGSVRELLGMTYYRLGQWQQCIRELTAFHELTGSATAHAYLADAHRALGHHSEVERLWEELRVDSPDAAIVAEGRIVAAGSLADRGRIADAISLLEKGKLSAKRIEDHHLRLWYALADLYERSGEVPRARELFGRIATHAPDFVDAADRRRALG